MWEPLSLDTGSQEVETTHLSQCVLFLVLTAVSGLYLVLQKRSLNKLINSTGIANIYKKKKEGRKGPPLLSKVLICARTEGTR